MSFQNCFIIIKRIFPKSKRTTFLSRSRRRLGVVLGVCVCVCVCVCVVRNFVAFAWSRGVVGSAGKRERERLTFIFFSRITYL